MARIPADNLPRVDIVFESAGGAVVQDIQTHWVKDAQPGVPALLADGSVTEQGTVAEAPPGEGGLCTLSNGGSQSIREVARLFIVLLALALVLWMAMHYSLPLSQWALNWAYVQMSEMLSTPIIQVPFLCILLPLAWRSIARFSL